MNFFKIIYYAYINTNNLYRSIIGYDVIKNINYNSKSELNKNYWSITKIFELLTNFIFIKLPIHSPSWLPTSIKTIFFGSNSKYIKNSVETDPSGNCFIYINGIMSNEFVVLLNKFELEKLLNKPINIIHNVTDSLIMDLTECLIGKETDDLTEASTVALYTICSKLLDKNIQKVIIIAHSQGTIIIAKVLNSLYKLGLNKIQYLNKLEIYCFANCASNMKYIKFNLPYMEHFANEHDFVAKLGCNCPKELNSVISIDGKIMINKNNYGHMLNTHYLNNFSNNYYQSRLNNYISKKIKIT